MSKIQIQKAKNFWFLKKESDYLRLVEEVSYDDNCLDKKEFRLESWYYNPEKTYWDSHEKKYIKKWVKQVVVTPASKADLSWLIKEASQIRVALTNIAYTAKKLPKEFSSKVKMEMCLVGERFNNLIREETLLKIAQACETMSARCMKAYRKTSAPCCKRYYSFFRALEQQAERLNDKLDQWISIE